MIPIYDRHTGELRFNFPGTTFLDQDLRTYDLRYANLAGYDLSGANLEGMDLEEIELSDAILEKTNLKNVKLREAVLTGAILCNAELTGADLSMTTFSRANLTDADLSQITFTGIVIFTDATAIRTKFREIRNLKGAIFWRTNCQDADFEGSDFKQVDVTDRADTHLNGTKFEYLMEEDKNVR